jgi:hypothetical protein
LDLFSITPQSSYLPLLSDARVFKMAAVCVFYIVGSTAAGLALFKRAEIK